MDSTLPINLEDLLRQRTLEGERIENKARGNPDAIIRTPCDETREPVEVRITPEDLVVLSFPGPDRSISMDELRQGRAVSRRYRNRRIGEFLKEKDLTEGRSTGIAKILRVMASNGSPAPEFQTDEERTFFLIQLSAHQRAIALSSEADLGQQVTPQVTPQVRQLLLLLARDGELTRKVLQTRTRLADREHFRKHYLRPALQQGLIEMTIPGKPTSRNQKYRLTDLGRSYLAQLEQHHES